jgi:hypothetical protein
MILFKTLSSIGMLFWSSSFIICPFVLQAYARAQELGGVRFVQVNLHIGQIERGVQVPGD